MLLIAFNEKSLIQSLQLIHNLSSSHSEENHNKENHNKENHSEEKSSEKIPEYLEKITVVTSESILNKASSMKINGQSFENMQAKITTPNKIKLPTIAQQTFINGKCVVGFCASGIIIRLIAPIIKNKNNQGAAIVITEKNEVIPLIGNPQIYEPLMQQLTTNKNNYEIINSNRMNLHNRTILEKLQQTINQTSIHADAQYINANACAKKNQVKLNLSIPTNQAKLITRIFNHNHIVLENHSPKTKDFNLITKQVKKIISENYPEIQTSITNKALADNALDNSSSQIAKIIFCQQPQVNENNLIIYPNNKHDTIDNQTNTPECNRTIKKGNIALVGIGPGSNYSINNPSCSCENEDQNKNVNSSFLTMQAKKILETYQVRLGYSKYIELARQLIPIPHATQITEIKSDNRQEIERIKIACEKTNQGLNVAIISGGDVNVFGMAATFFEAMAEQPNSPPLQQNFNNFYICPGISAFQALCSRIGPIFAGDFAIISLSSNLKPWHVIETRIANSIKSNLTIGLYNPPANNYRKPDLEKLKSLLNNLLSNKHKIIIASNLFRNQENITITTPQQLNWQEITMNTMLVISSDNSEIVNIKNKKYIFTNRYHKM